MKKVTRCYGCQGIIRVSGSFKAELPEVIVLTDEFGTKESRTINKKIVLCRDCARKAGYKVKPEYKVVVGSTHDPDNPFTNLKK